MNVPTNADASTVAANSQNTQYQQMQLMNQMTQIINNANTSCAKGTECYKKQQVADAQNAYQAALLTEKNAPQMVDDKFKNYLVASKGQSGANQALKLRYEKNGEAEKDKMTQQFNDWYNDLSNKMAANANHSATAKTLGETNSSLESNLTKIAQQDDDATNELNLLERKIHYSAQDVKAINGIEYYVKLLYWLAFLTLCACIVYDRKFTMKTGGLFVGFTLFILLQNRIMTAIGDIIPTDVHVKW
jgi:hypothetical protein